MKVLLVDDEEELVSTLAERLTLRGLSADWASSATTAMSMVQQQTYDVAVIDMKMPDIDGIALKRKLEHLCPDLSYIFMSGHDTVSLFQEGVSEIGAGGFYLLKPVDIDVLVDKINTVVTSEVRE